MIQTEYTSIADKSLEELRGETPNTQTQLKSTEIETR